MYSEKEKQYKKEYYQKNKDKIFKRMKKYYQENKDKWAKYRKQNREKIRARANEKYSSDPVYRKKVLEYQKRFYEPWKRIISEYCGSKIRCIKCGYDKNFGAIEFHHRNPEKKETTINKLLMRKPTPERIKELKKCDVICANCHREIHHPNLFL